MTATAKWPARTERGAEILRSIKAVYVERAGEWIGANEVVEATGLSRNTVCRRVGELAKAGELQHNGTGGSGSRYRTPTASGAEPDAAAPSAPQRTVKGARALLRQEEVRRLRLEREVMLAYEDGRARSPREVAVTIMRNGMEVRAIALDLCHRGLLRTTDSYRTFEKVTT